MYGSSVVEAMADFVNRVGTGGIFSTAAVVEDFESVLYNVRGSTDDPKIDGRAWKALLEVNGINGSCYVTNPDAQGSHPTFDVGGHMTTHESGMVPKGSDTHLMPLCKWHNSTARDGVPYSHSKTRMLLLKGYMEGELAATFLARLASDERFSVVYLADEEWKQANLTDEQAKALGPKMLASLDAATSGSDYALFERQSGDEPLYYVREVHLPSA